MSDDPRKLKAVLLSEASTEQQREFAKMLAEQCAEAERKEKGHNCWFFIPSEAEYEKMKKFAQPPNYDRCPKCGKGRIVVEVRRWNLGDSWHLVCRWSGGGCDFEEEISDPW